jgi:hypothetical protein
MKVHFRTLARDEFAGRVLDGPCEGDWVQADGHISRRVGS